MQKALCPPYETVTCDYVIEELRRNIVKKFPQKASSLDRFLAVLETNIKIIEVSHDKDDPLIKIRDDNDKPVLRAAIQAKADIFNHR